MSADKRLLFEKLGLSEHNVQHRALYDRMREEASAGRDRLSLSRDNLVENIRKDPSVQPPFAWDNLSETARHKEILNIYRNASPQTRRYYDVGAWRDGPNEENWVVKWCLWHVFRYRDNRNRARANGAVHGGVQSTYYNGYTVGGHGSVHNQPREGNGFWDPIRDDR